MIVAITHTSTSITITITITGTIIGTSIILIVSLDVIVPVGVVESCLDTITVVNIAVVITSVCSSRK